MGSLESLGFDTFFSRQLDALGRPDWVAARVVSEGRDRFGLLGCEARLGELSGRLRRELGALERPVVGDWVAVAEQDGRAVIHHVFERRTAMLRRAAGRGGGGQVLAANVDLFFVVTSANRDLNKRRLERYLTVVWNSGARPVLVLNKIDLGGKVDEMVEAIEAVALGVPLLRVSAATGEGLETLRGHLGPGVTTAFVGSSGVGKSSLINRLLGRDVQTVRTLDGDEKGRHATTRRELFELSGSGMLVDTPGLRELGLVEDAGGIEASFADVALLAEGCRFRDCRHESEPGCAVGAAVEAGRLDADRLAGYHKLQREIAAAERRADPLLAARPKREWKSITKAIREMYRIDPRKKK